MLSHITKFHKLPNTKLHAYFDFSKLVGYDCSLEITSWTEGLSWRSIYEDKNWRNDFYDYPKINFSFLIYADENEQWVSSLPPSLIQPLIDFETKHTVSMFPVLWILSRSQAACDLFSSAPFLFWVVIQDILKNDYLEHYILSIFTNKRQNILSQLNLPHEKSILKFINKLSYSAMSKQRNTKIWCFIQMFNYKKLNHLTSIPLSLVEFLSSNPQVISARFLNTIVSETDFNQLKHYLNDIYSMAEQLNELNHKEIIKNSRNLDALKRYHDRLSVKINHIAPEDIVYFTQTRLIPSPHIQAILSNLDLRDEGIEMEHCIFSYAPKITQGNYAAFKITHPERATLGAIIKSNGQYSIDQIQGKGNSSVSTETQEYVNKWFYSQFNKPLG